MRSDRLGRYALDNFYNKNLIISIIKIGRRLMNHFIRRRADRIISN